MSTANSLQRNPFWVLGATARDDRKRIVQRAEERSLEFDHDECQRARSQLTTPRTRLAAEMAWLPGVSPSRGQQLAVQVFQDPGSIRAETGLPPIAHLNLLVASFEMTIESTAPSDVAGALQQIASILGRIDMEALRRDINEDRAVSGFPQVEDDQYLHEIFAGRKRDVLALMRSALDGLPTTNLVEAITLAVDQATQGGTAHASELIDELVDKYEVEAHEFLEKEAANVIRLIEAATRAAKRRHRALYKLIERIEIVARNWDTVAQPIQLSAKARGLDHESSRNLGIQIRNLSLRLFNEFNLVEEPKRLTQLLQEVFAELPLLAERADEDASAIHAITAERQKWEREITYEAEVGIVFKHVLRISPTGVTFRGKTYGLDDITRLRWGGVTRSINGIPTGTTYTIAFGDRQSEAVVELRDKNVYSEFLPRLWRGVGARLATEYLQLLKDGNTLQFGDVVVADDYVKLKRHRILRSAEPVKKRWCDVKIWNADGSFCVGSTADKNTYAVMSYLEVPNVHVLEHVVRIAFERGLRKLSDVLEPE